MENKERRAHPKLWLLLICLVAFGIFYAWGSFYYQKNRQIERMIAAIADPKQELVTYVKPSNPDIELSSSSLKPLQSYFKHNRKAFKRLKEDLATDKKQGQIKLVQTGNYYGFFPKYQLLVQVYHPQVETNHPSSKLTVNGKDLGLMTGGDQNYYQDLGLVFPGRYHLLVNTKVSGRKLHADAVANIWSDKTIDLKIKTGTFLVRSVPYGKVYINDRKVKVLNKKGQALFKNYPLAKETELYITSEYQGKKIKSLTVKDLAKTIDYEFSKSDDTTSDYGDVPDFSGNQKDDVYQDIEGDYIVNPLWPGLTDVTEAKKLLAANYLKPDASDFVNEAENDSYLSLKSYVKKFKKAKKLKLQVKINKIMPAGANYSEVTYRISYKYHLGKKKSKEVILSNQIVMLKKVDEQQKILDIRTLE